MGDIEGTAKPIVGPMAQGIPTTLDAAAQRAVANWAVLKGLVAALVSKTQQPIPDRHYRRVCAAKGAPANTVRVWIGMRQNLAHPTKPGRAKLFDSHFMPVTNAARKGPVPADLERYISEVAFSTAVGHSSSPWCSSRLARAAVPPDAGIGRGAGLHFDLAGRRRRPVATALPVDVLGNTHHVTQFFQMARRWSRGRSVNPSRRQGAPVPCSPSVTAELGGMSDHEHVPRRVKGRPARTGRTKASRHISTSRLSRRSPPGRRTARHLAM